MPKLPSELWRDARAKYMVEATQGFVLIQGVNNLLEDLRACMHEALNLPDPNLYATTSVDNTRRLCQDLRTLTIKLALKARGLTQESLDEGELEEDDVRH